MKKKVLIIEDEFDDVLMFKTQFEIEGFEVVHAETAEEGFKKAKIEKPDLILLDIVLRNEDKGADPEKLEYSGIRLLNEFKQDPFTSSIPIIMLTNLGKDAYETKTRALGADDYLLKSELLPDEVVRRAKYHMQKNG